MLLIGTVIASIRARDLNKFVAFVGCFAWYVYPCSYVSTEGADKYLGFVVHTMSNRPCSITRRVEAEHGEYYVECFWAGKFISR
jgi:hypothetical protein